MLVRLGGVVNPAPTEIVPSPVIYGYRNSVRFTASPNNFFGLLEAGEFLF